MFLSLEECFFFVVGAMIGDPLWFVLTSGLMDEKKIFAPRMFLRPPPIVQHRSSGRKPRQQQFQAIIEFVLLLLLL